MTRIKRTYDHRLRDLVRSTGDIGHATRHGVTRSTARGWLTSARAPVVSVDVVDMETIAKATEDVVFWSTLRAQTRGLNPFDR